MLVPTQGAWAAPSDLVGPGAHDSGGSGSAADAPDPALSRTEEEPSSDSGPGAGTTTEGGPESETPDDGTASPGTGEAAVPDSAQELSAGDGAALVEGQDPGADAVGVQPSQATPVPAASTPALAQARIAIYNDTNRARAAVGLPTLRTSTTLDAIAQQWSQQQAAMRDMLHNPSLVAQLPAGWWSAAENVAFGYGYGEVTEAWINSPSHYRNIVGGHSHVGIGVAYDSYGFPYYTQVFATYPGAVPGDGQQSYPQPGQSFKDVGWAHTFYAPIEWMAKRGYAATGGGNQSYRAGAPTSRGAMATFMLRMSGEKFTPDPNLRLPYSDVQRSDVHYRGIAWMYVKGYAAPAEKYHPGGVVTRGAMATFLYRMNQGEPIAVPRSASYYLDVPAASTHAKGIEWMAANGYAVSGSSAPRFNPAEPVTRGAMAAFLSRIYG